MDLQNVCRTCMGAGIPLYSLIESITPRIQSPSSNVVDLWKIFSQILISYDSNFPQVICAECLEKIQQFYEFLEKTDESEIYLRGIIEEETKCMENSLTSDEFVDITHIKKEKLDYSDYPEYNHRKESAKLAILTPVQAIQEANAPITEIVDTPHWSESNKTNLRSQRPAIVPNKETPQSSPLLPATCTPPPTIETVSKTIENNDMDFLLDIIKHEPECVVASDPEIETQSEDETDDEEYKPNREKFGQEFVCVACSYRSRNVVSLENHILAVHTVGNFCKICKLAFPRNIRRHSTQHIPKAYYSPKTRLFPFKCTICQKPFRSKTGHGYHIVLKHGIVEPGENIFNCPQCPRLFKARSMLETHLRAHNGERPYNCKYCEKSFVQKGQLTIHQRRHTGEKPYQCVLCPKAFPDKSNYNKHLVSHDDRKRIRCQMCWKAFVKRPQLQKHRCYGRRS